MCLRGRKGLFKERLCRFIVWFGESHELSKDEAEDRERLVGTYLTLFGLLLFCSDSDRLQAGVIAFLIVFFVYCATLARSVGSKPIDKANKRKILFETFLIVCSVCTIGLQAGLMKYFIAFLTVSLIYYSMLARSVGSKPFRNLMALMAFAMACIFSMLLFRVMLLFLIILWGDVFCFV